ncbi:MAG: hypothetical protein IKB65_06050 [Ruminiclostridium sp.]|nr:hypothetical protein [Ruminiclostridium sp.]
MKREIKVESYVQTNGKRIPVEDLPLDQREALALWLKETYLNELFRGQGRVTAKEG